MKQASQLPVKKITEAAANLRNRVFFFAEPPIYDSPAMAEFRVSGFGVKVLFGLRSTSVFFIFLVLHAGTGQQARHWLA